MCRTEKACPGGGLNGACGVAFVADHRGAGESRVANLLQ